MLNQLFIQKSFPERSLYAANLAQKGKIVHYEVGETGTEKVMKGLKIIDKLNAKNHRENFQHT